MSRFGRVHGQIPENSPEQALITTMPSLAGSPGLTPGFSTTHENPNPNPEQKNRQETNPNQPNTNQRQEKEARTVTSCRKRLICRAALGSISERARQAGARSADKLPEEALAGRTRSRLEAVNHTRENLKPEFGSYMEDE